MPDYSVALPEASSSQARDQKYDILAVAIYYGDGQLIQYLATHTPRLRIV